MRDARFAFSLLTTLGGALAWAACSSVPDIQFVDDAKLDSGSSDASSGSSSGSGDGGGAKDGAVVTPPVTGVACVDAGAPSGSVCCGRVLCNGCSDSDCSTCLADCSGSTVCCRRGPNIKCGGSQGCQ